MVMIVDTPALATLLSRVGVENFLRALGVGRDAALVPDPKDPKDLYGYIVGLGG